MLILSGLPGVPCKGPSRLIPGPGVGASFKVQGQAFTLKAHAQALKRPALIHDVFHLFHLAQVGPKGPTPTSRALKKKEATRLAPTNELQGLYMSWGPTGPLITFSLWTRPSVVS